MLIKITIILLLFSIVNTQIDNNDDYYDLPVNPDNDSTYVYAYDIINFLFCTCSKIDTCTNKNCKSTNNVMKFEIKLYNNNNLIY